MLRQGPRTDARPDPRTGQRPTVTLTHAEWSDPVATALRLAMWRDIEVRYPEIAASTPGGFDVDDPQQGVGALSTVLAWIDGRAVGCATLRAARDGYPAGSVELRRSGSTSPRAAPVLLGPAQSDRGRRPHARTDPPSSCRPASDSPRPSRCYLSAGYRPVVPFFDFAGDFLSLWMAKDV